MENIKVSMRYAKAIYPVVKQEGYVIDFMEDLAKIVGLISKSRELKLLIDSPIISHSKKVSIFIELFKENISEITMNFILLLVAKGREKYINGIYHCVNLLYNKENGIVECRVVSAFELDEETKSRVEFFLKNTTHNSTKVSYVVDRNIIGGILLRVDDMVYDITIKNKLKELKRSLMM
jgi:F-type H+-transporting ATPase subunit delta